MCLQLHHPSVFCWSLVIYIKMIKILKLQIFHKTLLSHCFIMNQIWIISHKRRQFNPNSHHRIKKNLKYRILMTKYLMFLASCGIFKMPAHMLNCMWYAWYVCILLLLIFLIWQCKRRQVDLNRISIPVAGFIKNKD